jgi:hypothetical protein
MQRVCETLAGRATLLDLWPLGLAERVEGPTAPPSGLDRIWQEGEAALHRMAGDPPTADEGRLWRARAEDHFLWGGYPAIEPLHEEERRTWLRDFRRMYLERDLADLGRVADLDQFALAQNLLAARTGQILSYSEVARELGVAVNTVKRYVRFLEISYHVVLLRPLRPTLTARTREESQSLLDGSRTGRPSRRAERRIGRRLARDRRARRAAPLVVVESAPSVPSLLPHSRWPRGDFVLHAPDRRRAIEAKASQRAHRTDARLLAVRGVARDA